MFCICVKKKRDKVGSGFLKMIALENQNKITIDKPPDFFPPGREEIYIQSNYSTHIDDIYEINQLFRIEIYENGVKWKYDTDLYRWIGISEKTEKIKPFEYPILFENITLFNNQITLNFKPQRYFFIKNNGKLKGPYDYKEFTDNGIDRYSIILNPIKEVVDNSNEPHFIYEFNISVIKKYYNKKEYYEYNNQKFLGLNLKTIIREAKQVQHSKEDLISVKDLIDWANSQFNDRCEIEVINKFRNSIESIKDKNIFKERIIKLKSLVDKLDFHTNTLQILENEYIKRRLDSGESVLPNSEYSTTNLKNENDQLYKELERIENEKNLLSLKIEKLEKENNILKESNISNSDQTYLQDDKISSMQKEIFKFETQKNKLLDDIEYLNNIKQNNEKLVNQTSLELFSKLGEYKAYLDILTRNESKINIYKEKEYIYFNISNQEYNLVEYFQEISIRVKSLNKKIDQNNLINYITNIFQNFITTFAGTPGSGKTSLVSILGKAIGIEQNNSSRLLKVFTQRGWTSVKDIIGFYNPISDLYVSSTTGMYEFINEIKNSNHSELLNLILLDEANLSSMEHYWSSFLVMSDSPGADNNYIELGDRERNKLNINRNVRFVSTINIDHTTEILSPRLIDRSPIILVNPNQDITLQPLSSSDKNDFSSFNYDKLQELFIYKNGNTFTNSEEEILNEISRILRTNINYHYINFSPRRKEKIRNYVTITRNLHEGYSLLALDYAIAQHILPSINGNGDKYYKLLESLSNAFNNLTISRQLLRNIIERGEDEHRFFKFF